VDGAAWTVVACRQQIVCNNNSSHIDSARSSPPPLSHQRSPIPPHYILLALCLLARPSQSVFRVDCLCVRVRRQTFDSSGRGRHAVRAAHPSPCLVSLLSLTLSASSIAPAALLDSAWHRLLLHREPGAVVVVVLPSTRTARHSYSYTTQHEG
jgi:hypothetical protein